MQGLADQSKKQLQESFQEYFDLVGPDLASRMIIMNFAN